MKLMQTQVLPINMVSLGSSDVGIAIMPCKFEDIMEVLRLFSI
jgi:hypothetical protein